MKKLALTTALITIAMSSATNAGVVNLPGGVSFDPRPVTNSDFAVGNFESTGNFIQWWDNDGDRSTGESLSTMDLTNPANIESFTLNGIGEIITNGATGTFECSGCELTAEFGGLGLDFTADPDFNANLTGAITYVQNNLDNNGDFVTPPGFGSIDLTFLNGLGDLTDAAVLGDLLVQTGVVSPGTIGFDLSEAFLNVYLDYDGINYDEGFFDGVSVTSNVLDGGTASLVDGATDGDLWLALDFVDFDIELGTEGPLGLASANTAFALEVDTVNSEGYGFTGVTGPGLATDNIVSQAIQDITRGFDFADIIGFDVGAQFDFIGGSFESFSGDGAGSFTGFAVPEPSTVAFMGLGLLGLGLSARRRRR